MGAGGGEETGDTHSYGPGAGEDDGVGVFKHFVFHRAEHSGGGGRVAAVGVHHHRDTHGPEEGAADFAEEVFALGDVAAADEDGGAGEVFYAAGEDRAMNEAANGSALDVAISEEMIGAAIDGDDGVESAGVTVWV